MAHIPSGEDELTTPGKKSLRTRKKLVTETQLTSDSEEDFTSVKRGKDEIMLGEISLLTSDEEYEPQVTKTKKKASKPKKIKCIDLLTSDEDDAVVTQHSTPKAIRKKRKLADQDDNTDSVPAKKTKATVSERKPKKTTTTRKKAAEKSLNIPSPDLNVSSEDVTPLWSESELLAERSQIDEDLASNLINLWKEGNTIPFIARYRKHMIGTMTPEALRTTKEEFDEICNLKKKMCTIAKAVLTQAGKLDNKLQANICAARSFEELEYIYAPFKSESKGSLAERARKCGLEEPALHLLNNTAMVNPVEYVDIAVKEVKTVEDVEQGIVHIIAAEIATDVDLIKFLRELRANTTFRLQTKQRARQSKVKEKQDSSTKPTKKKSHLKKDSAEEEAKFELYFDFIQRVDYLKSHQILAINRGESLKILNVKIIFPESFEKQFKYFCMKKWTNITKYDEQRQAIVSKAIEDAFQRLITPLITREIRADLKQRAEKESCSVFSDNLKHLLLFPPMKGKSILGIDPGYTNGCKLALISPTGSVLAHNVVYPHNRKNGYRGEKVIKDLLLEYKCNLIALGNGTACRQTEEWISGLIGSNYFSPMDVQYTIVSEDGASIYSCSQEAQKEFGSLDPNIISAVSLARRIQDPMAELVKVEPCHLGIGMYQLDIKKKQLEEALSEVVSECVSFVGVDLNTASQCLLRRVAGLSDKRATQIIDHRNRNGPFTQRVQLLNVFGIGERIFEQCAGFLRVGPINPYDTNFYRSSGTTPLDATIIHPESYPTVRRLLLKLDLKEKDIGTDEFIRAIKDKAKSWNFEVLAHTLQTDKQNFQLIFDALTKPLNHDLRSEVNTTPLFKKGITTMEDLAVGTVLTGRVKNVTSFGAFVDIGVGHNGLVHVRHMRGLSVHLGNVLEVKVLSVDMKKGHIQLEALRKVE